MLTELRRQTNDLLAYFPGKGKRGVVWLVLLPILATLGQVALYAWIVKPRWNERGYLEPDFLLLSIWRLSTCPILLMFVLSMFVSQLRIYSSRDKSLYGTACIVASSTLHALIISIPFISLIECLLLAGLLGVLPVSGGTSVLAIFTLMAVTFLSLGAVLLVVSIAAWIVHRRRILVPGMLVAVWFYKDMVPINSPGSTLGPQWGNLAAFLLPLYPEAVLMEDCVVHWPPDRWIMWCAALIHAALGFTIAYFVATTAVRRGSTAQLDHSA